MNSAVFLNSTGLSYLINRWNAMVDMLYAPSQHRLYLGIFRVYVAFHLIKKLVFAWPYLEMLYGSNSFIQWENTSFQTTWIREHYILMNCLYLFAAFLMAFGIGRRYTVAVVYVFQELMNNTNGYILDGGDNLLKFGLFYLVLTNSFDHFCVCKRTLTKPWQIRLDNFLTNLGVLALVIHLMMVYFISGVSKIHADVWYNGTAVYYTLLGERFMGTSWNKWLVQNAFLVTMATYVTMIWEAAFPFLIINKRIRIPVLLVGVMLHLGIYIFMMINAFQVYFISLYGFFFTDTELRKF